MSIFSLQIHNSKYFQKVLNINQDDKLYWIVQILEKQPLPFGWSSSIAEGGVEYFWNEHISPQWESPNEQYFAQITNKIKGGLKLFEINSIEFSFTQSPCASVIIFLQCCCFFLVDTENVQLLCKLAMIANEEARDELFQISIPFLENLSHRIQQMQDISVAQYFQPYLRPKEQLKVPRFNVVLFDIQNFYFKLITQGQINIYPSVNAAKFRPNFTQSEYNDVKLEEKDVFWSGFRSLIRRPPTIAQVYAHLMYLPNQYPDTGENEQLRRIIYHAKSTKAALILKLELNINNELNTTNASVNGQTTSFKVKNNCFGNTFSILDVHRGMLVSVGPVQFCIGKFGYETELYLHRTLEQLNQMRQRLIQELIKIGKKSIVPKFRDIPAKQVKEIHISVNDMGCVVTEIFQMLTKFKSEAALKDYFE